MMASRLSRANPMFAATASRGVYTDETRPFVFINEHTKVICQGMTGKHVSETETKFGECRHQNSHCKSFQTL